HKKELLNQAVVNIDEKHKEQFPLWFKRKLYTKGKSISIKKLYHLAMGPDVRGRTHTGCIINGVRYHIRRLDELRKSQNCGRLLKQSKYFTLMTQNWERIGKLCSNFKIDTCMMCLRKILWRLKVMSYILQMMKCIKTCHWKSNSIVCDTVDMLSQLHRDDVDSVILDANVIELEAQKEHEVH
ncbi:hypothetical protein H5410_021918, partial [Solanum commersonii]